MPKPSDRPLTRRSRAVRLMAAFEWVPEVLDLLEVPAPEAVAPDRSVCGSQRPG